MMSDKLESVTHYPKVLPSNRITMGTARYVKGGQAMMATGGDQFLDDPRSYKEEIGRSNHVKLREAMEY